MLQIIISTFILSAIHALIPNHWIPIIAVGKAERWNQRQTLFATIFSGFAHTLSTILIGVMVGFAGYKFSQRYTNVSEQIAPLILIALGIVYILVDVQRRHHHQHHDHNVKVNPNSSGSWSVLLSLSLSMFLTPCVEIEAYYFQAGAMGWLGIFMVSLVYTLTTVLFMLGLVYAGYKGAQRLRSHFLEHHEKLITGVVLVVLGVIAWVVRF